MPARSIRSRARSVGPACGVALLLSLFAPRANAQNPIPAAIPHGPQSIQLAPIVGGLTSPLELTSLPNDPSRMAIVEQTGQIRLLVNGILQPTPFLDMSSTIVPMRTGYDERGLLGVTFDPGFSNPADPGYRRIFTWQSEPTAPNPTYPLTTPGTVDHQNVLTSWRVSANNPNQIDPASRTDLMRMHHPSFNHDAGSIAFGPDGYLYLGTGDGGGSNDSGNGHNPTIGNSQDLASPLGKMLRIDVNGTSRGNYGIPADNPYASGAVPEIYATGFRNPYRFSFDGSDLIVADVGQNNIEEINLVTKGGNYGWRYKEGTFRFNPANGTVSSDLTGVPTGLIDPVAQYDHDEGIAIVGGFVYRGTKLPSLSGKYVFGDFSRSFSTPSGRLFYADLVTGEIREFIIGPNDLPLGMFVKGIGQDADNELYLLATTRLAPTGTTGQVFAIVPEPTLCALAAATVFIARRRRVTRIISPNSR
jgi:glucose/arabinose dehydrogenase